MNNDEPKKLTSKTVGLLVALPFASECIGRGAIVSEPFGDDARYDVVVDNGKRLLRVQVKTACLKSPGVFYFNGRQRSMIYRSPNGDSSGPACYVTPYAPHEVDCVVTNVLGLWYVYDEPHTFKNNVYIYPDKPDSARSNWSALGLSPQPIYCRPWQSKATFNEFPVSSPGESPMLHNRADTFSDSTDPLVHGLRPKMPCQLR